jgi:hypothetical protein
MAASVAQRRQARRHVGFGPADHQVQALALRHQPPPGRRQPQQHLAKADDVA